MEEEEDGEMGTPFWVQSTSNVRRVDRFRRGVSSLIFSSGVLLFILLVTAVFFMLFAIPSTIHTAHLKFFTRSNAVMKKWDSVNLVLVLVALFFGFISKNNNRNYNNVVADDIQSTTTTTSDNNQNYYNYHLPQNNSVSSNVVAQKSAPDTGWYEEYSDRRDSGSSSSNYNYYYAAANNNSPRLRRNSTSYPDLHLRQQILSTPSVDYYNVNDQRRYYDDSPVYYRRPSWKQSDASADYDNIQVKNIYVDDNDAVNSKQGGQKFEETSYVSPPSYSPPPPSPPPPPPPPPRRRAADQKAKRIYESESLPSEYQSNKDVRVVDSEVLQKSSIPPPPPPLPPLQYRVEKSEGSEYKKRNAGKDQNFLTSYYQKKKKKRQRQRSADNLDALFHRSQAPKTHTQPPPPPPPPPPPRPSSSVFHNLFSSKKAKRRKIPSDLHLHPPSPPPPPPPPPPQFKAAPVYKPKPNIQTPTTYKPPVPIKLKSFNSFDDNSSSGGSSPLHFIPPPPPLPPFKIPEWKHVVKGDYVSIESNPSSRSGSPDTDEADNISPAADPTASPVSLFCPSPDVDTKADNFIARFRAGLKLEKIDSFNKKQVSRMSNLGPGSAPSQD